MTGTAILIEYTLAPAVVATFIGGYMDTLIGFGGPIVYLLCYLVFVGIHLYGVGEALKVTFAITAIAVVAIAAFILGMIPQFEVANLFDIQVTNAAGASSFLPFGFVGIWAAFPFAIWFSSRSRASRSRPRRQGIPRRTCPRGSSPAWRRCSCSRCSSSFSALGGRFGGVHKRRDAGGPLCAALALQEAYGGTTVLGTFVNIAGLAALIASFFSIIFAYSRQLFALSRAGYLPRLLSVTGGRRTPWVALVVPAVISPPLAHRRRATLLNAAVFGAAISYVLMMLSHIVLRSREPDLERPYRTPGGVATPAWRSCWRSSRSSRRLSWTATRRSSCSGSTCSSSPTSSSTAAATSWLSPRGRVRRHREPNPSWPEARDL